MASHPLLQFFSYSHLPPNFQLVSSPFRDLAVHLIAICPMNPELTVSLRKLLESKDCAVRSTVYTSTFGGVPS